MTQNILVIDQGTTSSRAILYDAKLKPLAMHQLEFEQIFPDSGWVEHRPFDLWDTVVTCCKEVLKAADADADIVIGITNQRETTLVWDRLTGEPIYNAIVWQDRRTADICEELKADGKEALFTDKSGLLLDPYFSGTKIAWLLNQVPGARDKAERGELAFGTVDSWLIWNLTKGERHVTEATNASRTLVYNIHEGAWDAELLSLLDIPQDMMPTVMDSAADFATADASIFGKAMPICGIAGDQQAALIGQACFEPGMLKSTYGTGCFALVNTGKLAFKSRNRLLTTVAYQLDGETYYALEGSIFIAGAVVQWLRDSLGIIKSAADTEGLALEADPNQNVMLVPAFTGLGAPYWNADARGVLTGLERSTGPKEISKAALESMGFQTNDLMKAMRDDWNALEGSSTKLRVDGGMTANGYVLQSIADLTGTVVERSKNLESTALGAAGLAALGAGWVADLSALTELWELDASFTPTLPADERATKLAAWEKAVRFVNG